MVTNRLIYEKTDMNMINMKLIRLIDPSEEPEINKCFIIEFCAAKDIKPSFKYAC